LSQPIEMNSNVLNASTWFWLTAGIAIGVAATLSMATWWRSLLQRFGRVRTILVGSVSTLSLGMFAVLLYSQIGRPDAMNGSLAATSTGHPGAMPMNTGDPTAVGNAQSMEAVAERLSTRLARGEGSDEDWQLLAQSYDFMGRSADAERARKHVVSAVTAPTSQVARAPAQSREAESLLQQANALRLKRNYPEALGLYEKVLALNGMTADSWADYADVLASKESDKSRQGKAKLSGAPAKAIDQALAIDPNHSKALWLKASLAHEEHRYVDALSVWQHLRQVIGDNESDARIIDANIAEAQQLSETSTQQQAPQKSERSMTSVVTGTIDIDPKLASRAAPGTTLFIFAKAIDASGPPLAVYRTTVSKWPVQFKLDDSMAMLPTRNLSSATQVIIEARISVSGQATALAGDLQTTGARVTVREGKQVRLRIDKVVG
jgi:cytochrome c-type biogenesis protein CcmH